MLILPLLKFFGDFMRLENTVFVVFKKLTRQKNDRFLFHTKEL
ncbi:hypothetical Protein YC6258_01581 [Gynuella sunshinyii YC6258]|uniref:Uncharacterized protein n=1 Tax=Gynuella sunshinyii YC6258 TaxID=1445510 RepID=A0A0C5VTI6_9GAMM|nr:hypothetical Protein YC6258_01581 [Gynuella sunshinyii YC6258]